MREGEKDPLRRRLLICEYSFLSPDRQGQDPAALGGRGAAYSLLGWVSRLSGNETRLYELDALTQSGFLALVDAIQGYDPEAGNFVAYLNLHARKCFREAMGIRSAKQRPEIGAISLELPIGETGDDSLLGLVPEPTLSMMT